MSSQNQIVLEMSVGAEQTEPLLKLLMNLESTDPGCIVNGRVLKAADSAAVLGLQVQEFHIDLDVMPRNLLFIARGLHSAGFGILRQSVEPVTEQHLAHTCRRDLNPVVSIQVSGNSKLPEVIGRSEMDNLFLDVGRCS